MKHFKTILIILLALNVISPAFSRDLVALGTGETREEAEFDARGNLSSFIRSTVKHGEEYSVYADDDADGSAYSRRTEVNADINMIGLELEYRGKEKGLHTVEARISEDKAEIYEEKVESLNSWLSGISLDRKFEKSLEAFQYYDDAYRNMVLYEDYKLILQLLQEKAVKDISPIPFTIYELKSKQESMLSNAISETAREQAELDLRQSRKFDAKLELIQDQLAENLSLLKAQQEEDRKRNLEKIDKLTENASEEVKAFYERIVKREEESIRRSSLVDIETVFVTLDDLRSYYAETEEDLYRELDSVYSDFNQGIKAIVDEEYTKPYSSFELDGYVPYQKAIEKRVSIARQLVEKYEKSLSDAVDNIWFLGIDQLNGIRSNFINTVYEHAGVSYEFDSFSDSMFIRLNRYDLDEDEWSGSLTFNLIGTDFEIPFSFSYSDITGKNLPSDYDEQLLTIKKVEDVIRDILVFNVEYKLHVDWDEKVYYLKVYKVNVSSALDFSRSVDLIGDRYWHTEMLSFAPLFETLRWNNGKISKSRSVSGWMTQLNEKNAAQRADAIERERIAKEEVAVQKDTERNFWKPGASEVPAKPEDGSRNQPKTSVEEVTRVSRSSSSSTKSDMSSTGNALLDLAFEFRLDKWIPQGGNPLWNPIASDFLVKYRIPSLGSPSFECSVFAGLGLAFDLGQGEANRHPEITEELNAISALLFNVGFCMEYSFDYGSMTLWFENPMGAYLDPVLAGENPFVMIPALGIGYGYVFENIGTDLGVYVHMKIGYEVSSRPISPDESHLFMDVGMSMKIDL